MEEIRTGRLPTHDGHDIFFYDLGNSKGPVILSFHGGPGSKSKVKYAHLYDLQKYRVILFDQRGCGESLPRGEIQHNTTMDTLQDAERLREYLGIDTWFVSGGSWGATLALLYAQSYPQYVQGLLISSVFLADHATDQWSMHSDAGVAQIMPDVWKTRLRFLNHFSTTPKTAAKDLLALMMKSEMQVQKEIVAGVQNWEGNIFSLDAPVAYTSAEDIDEEDIASAKIFLHYEAQGWFLEKDQIMAKAESLQNIPMVVVHGRYDLLCPLARVYTLVETLPKAEIFIADASGHVLSPEGKLVQKLAMQNFLLKNGS